MKKIFVILTLVFMPMSFSEAAVPKCDGNVAPDLQMGDPACYTSVSSGYWKTCTWYGAGSGSYWACDNGVQGTSSSVGTNCVPYLEALYSTCGGYGGCSNRTDFGAGDTYSEWVGTTVNTCYYTIVNTWGECDFATGLQFATSVTQKSVSGTNCQNLNEETSQSCAACGIASNTPTGVQPTEDLCIPLNTASTPTLNTTTNMWEWTCTADNGSVNCDTPNSVHGVCSSSYTGYAFETQAEFDAVVASGDLCETGIVANASGDEDSGWTWDCMHIGTMYTDDDLDCQAPCFDYSLNLDKSQFYWDDSDQVDVTINIEKVGACKDQYSCTVTDATETGTDTYTRTISAEDGVSAYDVSGICSRSGYDDEDRTETVNGNCIARSCNAQGKCQGVPQSASSSGSCTSTCSSDADCTTGRMIETRP